ncbi:MAG: hypothetical protein IKM17_04995 [Lentisphaeria bacterium]|nr:hypothetical protein [Lentisphaeria bacterium]MBR4075423.1 hypothetical protein [Lentisphaeria bacterium]
MDLGNIPGVRREKQTGTRGADPSRITPAAAGGCVTLLFSGGGKAPELLRTAPPEKSMPDQPCG